VGTLPTLSYSNPSGDGVTWVVTFSGSGVAGGSIADGVYNITLNASAVTNNGVVAVANNDTEGFYRLTGDLAGYSANGNQAAVTAQDLAAFKKYETASQGQNNFKAAFDFLANGSFTAAELTLFKKRETVIYSGFSDTI
jgi:hypothetical protein